MAYNPNNANGQATSANSAPVVLSSDQQTILQDTQDVIATQTSYVIDTSVDADAIRVATESLDGKFVASLSLADGKTNPSTTMIGAGGMTYNGSTWDRTRGATLSANISADTGTKTASFLGATQTNYNSRGVIVTIICGTVSGTLPTLTTAFSFSPDDGTTWLDLGTNATAVTTTGNSICFTVYPGANTSNSTGATQSRVISMPLPRTWRIRYVIGGTTPSFAITSVLVNYIP